MQFSSSLHPLLKGGEMMYFWLLTKRGQCIVRQLVELTNLRLTLLLNFNIHLKTRTIKMLLREKALWFKVLIKGFIV